MSFAHVILILTLKQLFINAFRRKLIQKTVFKIVQIIVQTK